MNKLKITILFGMWKVTLISIVIFLKLFSPSEKWVVEKYRWCYPKMVTANNVMFFEEVCQDRFYLRKEK